MISIAFFGCGKITRSHSKLLRKIDPGIRRFYASRSSERAETFNRELHGAGAFGSYEDAIRDVNVDVAFICTPPDSHLDLAIASLQSGKHVIVEKPPFLSVADFDRAAEVAQRNDLRLLVAENYYYKPLALVLRRLLAEEVIGALRFVYINALKKQKTENWRDDPSIAGGGALFEGGIHWINFIANLGVDVRSVTAYRSGKTAGLDRSSLVVFELEGGAIATLSYSWEIPSLFQGLRISRIFGTHGSITFETNGLFVLVGGVKKRVILPGLSDISGYRAMLEDFVRSLSTGSEPEFTTDLARQDVTLLEQAYINMNP